METAGCYWWLLLNNQQQHKIVEWTFNVLNMFTSWDKTNTIYLYVCHLPSCALLLNSNITANIRIFYVGKKYGYVFLTCGYKVSSYIITFRSYRCRARNWFSRNKLVIFIFIHFTHIWPAKVIILNLMTSMSRTHPMVA